MTGGEGRKNAPEVFKKTSGFADTEKPLIFAGKSGIIGSKVFTKIKIPFRKQMEGKRMEYGYARCSTNEGKQDIERQTRELKAAGAEMVVCEYAHGDARVKDAQISLLEKVTEGDTIIVTEVSRLSRSTQQLCEIINTVKEKRLRLMIIGSITIDCRSGEIDPMSQAFMQMSAVFAELELSMIRARVKSGMENAKAKGAKIGRPVLTADGIPAIFYRHYPAYAAGSLNIAELARVCDMSRTTIYKYLKMVEKAAGK